MRTFFALLFFFSGCEVAQFVGSRGSTAPEQIYLAAILRSCETFPGSHFFRSIDRSILTHTIEPRNRIETKGKNISRSRPVATAELYLILVLLARARASASSHKINIYAEIWRTTKRL